MNPKLEQLLQSRKFWTATLILAASLGLWELGEISGEQLAACMVVSGSIYMGSVALEDGLATALKVWLSAVSRDARPVEVVVRQVKVEEHGRPDAG